METKGHEMTYRRLDLHAYLGLRFLAEASSMALSVMVGWTVYDISRRPLSLGIVGIVEFIPALLLTLPAGELCDRLSPHPIIVASLALECVCSFAFLTLHWMHWRALWLFYGVVLASGLAKAFAEPAVQAMLPCLVRAGQLPRAVAFSSTAWQMAVVLGPVVGGLAYAIDPALAYLGCAAAWFAAMLLATMLRAR